MVTLMPSPPTDRQMPDFIVKPERLLKLSCAAYPVEAILHVAYELASEAVIWLAPASEASDASVHLIAFAARPDGLGAPIDDRLSARFLDKLTDQTLRVMLRDSTAPIRNAVFDAAMAAVRAR
jgi:His-Xaa-Ser system protein HxsD